MFVYFLHLFEILAFLTYKQEQAVYNFVYNDNLRRRIFNIETYIWVIDRIKMKKKLENVLLRLYFFQISRFIRIAWLLKKLDMNYKTMFYNREKNMIVSEKFKKVHNQTTLQKNFFAISYITKNAVKSTHNMIILETEIQLCSTSSQVTTSLYFNLHYFSFSSFDSTFLIWMFENDVFVNVAYTFFCLRLFVNTVFNIFSSFSFSIVWYFLL